MDNLERAPNIEKRGAHLLKPLLVYHWMHWVFIRVCHGWQITTGKLRVDNFFYNTLAFVASVLSIPL